MDKIRIEFLQTLKQFNDTVELQRIVWKLQNYKDCIPDHMLLAIVESGGYVIGAYQAEKLVGFSVILPAVTEDSQVYQRSHILGIHPDVQHENIGYKMKIAHMGRALKDNINKIVWTYDPLLGANANLNIKKLGGICNKYFVDVYGEVMGGSELVSGLPSDRFLLEWHIGSKTVKNRFNQKEIIDKSDLSIDPVNTVEIKKNDLQEMTGFSTDHSKEEIFIQIPSDFQKIYDTDKGLAMDWRMKFREMIIIYFEMGYTVVDFYRSKGKCSLVENFYLLEKDYKLE
ncbi:hypothetical protein ACFL7D_04525 [candidate division KSB1 bacterium]